VKKKSFNKARGKPKTWIITLLLAAVAISYLIFIFVPSQRSIGRLRSQFQERRQQIIQAQTLLSTVDQARTRLTETRSVSESWRKEAPRQAVMITHFASLTQQAQSAGVAIERLDPLPAVELNLVAQQDVTMQFNAPFAAVFDFLRRLESLPGTLWIRKLRLHSSGTVEGKLQGELTLTIFVDSSH
jgi:Tfp pilus assembly protein PilO